MWPNRKRKCDVLLFSAWWLVVGVAAQGEEPPNVFLAIQLQATNDLPPDCQAQFQLPGRAISGQAVDWDFMCSGALMVDCADVMEYTFRLQYTVHEKDFVMQILRAFTVGGADYLCQLNQSTIQGVMSGGGASCMTEVAVGLDYCSYVSILKFSTGNDPESLCKTLDYSLECALRAIRPCQLGPLESLWGDYYRRVLSSTICERFTPYKYDPSHAPHHRSHAYLIATTLLLLLGLLILRHLMV